jgi:hypothetical protein
MDLISIRSVSHAPPKCVLRATVSARLGPSLPLATQG